jgi:hypothetical protein
MGEDSVEISLVEGSGVGINGRPDCFLLICGLGTAQSQPKTQKA